MKKLSFAIFLGWLFAACNNQPAANQTAENKTGTGDSVSCPPNSKLNVPELEQITGLKGTGNNGELKFTVPQNDLHVMVDGFKIIPPMGLGSWAAFSPCGDSAMVMGDIIVTETDLKPVEQEVINHGLGISAIHNHFLRDHPHVMYMHIDGFGGAARLADAVRSVFEKVKQLRGKDPGAGEADSVVNSLDLPQLDSIIGYKGKMNKGVYKYTIGRPDVSLRAHGMPVSTFMGFNTWASWQGTMEKAAVAGDFTMLKDEVEPVIRALVGHGIEVVAVHNHMVQEEPRIFFLHYWGVGPAGDLARGLRAALDQTGVAKAQ